LAGIKNNGAVWHYFINFMLVRFNDA